MTTESAPAGWVTAFAGARRQLAVGLGCVALVFVVLTIWWGTWGWQGRKAAERPPEPEPKLGAELDAQPEPLPKARSVDYLPAAVWAGLMAVLAGGAAAWLASQPLPESVMAKGSQVRAEALTVGAIAGLITSLLGFLLGIRWQDSLFKWVNDGTTQEARWVLIAASIFTAGLILMFLSLQIGRTEERTNAVLRRMLYGFNAAFLGILLVMVLLIVNVVSFLKVPTTLMTTDRAFSELSEPSKTFLGSLEEPVHVYMILPEKYVEEVRTRSRPLAYTRLYSDTRLFLENCEEMSPHFQADYLSPGLDTNRIVALKNRLNVSAGEQELIGLIVTVGEDEKEVSFIPSGELIDAQPIGPRTDEIVFQGESRLLTEISGMIAARTKEVIYFTQDNRELSISGNPGPRTALEIVAYLRDRKMRVEPLKLTGADAKVPDDAAVVVVAGPQTPFPADGPALKALRAYLKPTEEGKKPGRLLAYLPAVRGLKQEVQETGLEPLLEEFGIQVSRDRRLVSAPRSWLLERDRQGRAAYLPPEVALGFVPDGLQAPVRPTLARLPQHLMLSPRVLRAAPGGPGGMRTTVLLETRGQGKVTWEEADWTTQAVEIQELFEQGGEAADRLAAEKRRTSAPVPLAIAALESTGGDAKRAERARVVVYASDFDLSDTNRMFAPVEIRGQAMSDTVDWLRDREASIGIPPKKTHSFEVGKGPDLTGLLMLLAIMVVVISGCGLGVWLSRRR